MRKGQVSLWIILGIVVLILVVIGILLVTMARETPKPADVDMLPIKAYVDDCIDQTSLTAIFTAGRQGGYIFPRSDYVLVDFNFVSLGFDVDRNVLVTEGEMEKEIENYIKVSLPDCVQKLRQRFASNDYDFGKVEAVVDVTDNKVHITVDYPIKVKKNGGESRLEKSIKSYDVRLGHARTLAYDIVEGIKRDPDWIDVTQLAKIDMQANIVPQNEGTIIYVLSEPSRYNEDLVFAFGARFRVNNPPEINMPDEFRLRLNERFIHKVEATDSDGDTLTFRNTNVALFTISEEGVIDFVPLITGNFAADVIVQDSRRGIDQKTVRFIIT